MKTKHIHLTHQNIANATDAANTIDATNTTDATNATDATNTTDVTNTINSTNATQSTYPINTTYPQNPQGILWLPDDETPELVLHIIHGMTEHMGRYAEFARVLTDKQIAVAGFDLPGHGVNASDTSCAVFRAQDWENSLAAIHAFQQELHRRFPGAKHVLLGFSLGSFLLRDYLSRYLAETQGVILMGTGDQPAWILCPIIQLVKQQIKTCGYGQTTPLIRKLSVENYNKYFRPNRTEYDWLCSDMSTLREYMQDDLCKKEISAGLFLQLLEGIVRTGKMTSLQNWDKQLPVLLISGRQDPVGNFEKGVKSVYRKLQRSGFSQTKIELIPEARHDLLHEKAGLASQRALEVILAWLSEITVK